MADGNDFILSLVGELDKAKTTKNVQDALNEIGKNVKASAAKGGAKSSKIQVFDIDQLNRDKIKYVEAVGDVKAKIRALYQEAGDKIDVRGIQNATGEVTKYMVAVTKANQIIAQFNLERATVGEGLAYVQTGGGFIDKGFGTNLTKQLELLRQYSAEIDNIKYKYLAGNGNNVLKDQGNVEALIDDLYNYDQLIKRLKTNAGFISQADLTNLKVMHDELLQTASAMVDLENKAKVSQKAIDGQLSKFQTMSGNLQNIKNKYLINPSSNMLIDPNHIAVIATRINALEGRLSSFKSKAGEVTESEVREYNRLYTELNRVITRFSLLEKAQTKQEKQVNAQKFKLEDYARALQTVNDTTLNPQSTQALTDPSNIANVTQKYQDLDKIIKRLEIDNKNGQVIPVEKLREARFKLSELTDTIKTLRKEEHATLDADTSQGRLFQNVAIEAQKLQTFIQQLKSAGLYTNEFKTQIESLTNSLNNVNTPKELESYQGKLVGLREEAKRAGLVLRDEIASSQLSDKVKILSAQIQGYMQQNSKATIMFGDQFKTLLERINTVSNENDLKKLQSDFELLKLNINSAGQSGLTFGERMAAAAKKFMLWTGMTNSVMYLVRTIKQMISVTKELDTSMVSLKKVTDETETTYKKMFNTASESAKELNTDIKNIIDSTAEFAKLGYDTGAAEELAKVANVYKNVGELDITDATESLISTIAGFKDLTADDAWKIIDEFNNVGKQIAHSL